MTEQHGPSFRMPNTTKYGPELPIVLLNALPDPVLVKDAELRYVWINSAFEAFFGLQKCEVIGRRDDELFPKRQVAQSARVDLRVLQTGETDEIYETLRGRGGAALELVTHKTRIELSDGTRLLAAIMHDVTDISLANRELERTSSILEERATALQRLADTDALTGCLNRRALFDRAVCEGSGRRMGIILMDLDHFKSVNDTYGHEGGDQALHAFVKCARNQLRGTDLFARLGGEEFAVVLPDMPGPELYAIANRIRTAWENMALVLAGRPAKLTVSIGATVWPAQETLDLDAALAAADRNLYAAKQAGRNRVVMQTAA